MTKIAILDGYTIDIENRPIPEFESFGNVACFNITSPGQVAARIQGCTAVFTDGTPITEEIMDGCPELKYIGIMATGTNAVDLEAAKKHGIVVTNVPAYGSRSVAQHGFALLLYLTNRLSIHTEFVRNGAWTQGCKDDCGYENDGTGSRLFWENPSFELWGRTAGIVGYGDIGRQFARMASGFGMNVVVATDYPVHYDDQPPVEFVTLDELLKRADVISLHRPLTEKTKKLISKDSFLKMKKGVYLINTARGGLIDEDALVDAIKSGKVAGVGLDVLTDEPPRQDNPLLGLENCTVTPHVAWVSEASRHRLVKTVLENYQAFCEGEEMNRVV